MEIQEKSPWEISEKNNLFLYGWKYHNNEYYGKPGGVCPLFWQGILGLILLVFTPLFNIPTLILSYFRKSPFLRECYYLDLSGWQRFFLQIFALIIYYFFVIMATPDLGNPFHLSLIPLWVWVWGWLIPVGIIAVVMGVVYGIIQLIGWIKGVRLGSSQNMLIFTQGIKSTYTKLCPRIIWKDE